MWELMSVKKKHEKTTATSAPKLTFVKIVTNVKNNFGKLL